MSRLARFGLLLASGCAADPGKDAPASMNISDDGVELAVLHWATVTPDFDGDGVADMVAKDSEAGLVALSGGPDVRDRLGTGWFPVGPDDSISLFASQVASGPDTTGDELADVLVGGLDAETGEPLAAIYSLAGGAPARVATLTGVSGRRMYSMSKFATPVGDISGDGVGETVVIGLTEEPDTGEEFYELRVFEGPVVGDLVGDDAAASVGRWRNDEQDRPAIAPGGDLTGDGIADLAVHLSANGVQVFDWNALMAGEVEGAYATFTGQTVDSGEAWGVYPEQLGHALLASTDFDGDGRSDIALGAPAAGAPDYLEGATCIWAAVGSGSHTAEDAEHCIDGESAYALSGDAIHAAPTAGGIVISSQGTSGDPRFPEQPPGRLGFLGRPLAASSTADADVAYLLPENSLGPYAALSSGDVDADDLTDVLYVSPDGARAWLLPGTALASLLP